MSSKSTIFLTNNNEHCYEDCNEAHYENDKFIGYSIIFEMDKKNVNVVLNDSSDLIVEIFPGSELYEIIQKTRT